MKEFKKRKFQKKKMFDVQQLLIGLNDLIAKKREKKKRIKLSAERKVLL